MQYKIRFTAKRVIILLLLGVLSFPITVLASSKPRVAVAEFSVKVRKAHYKLGTAMSDILIDALVESGKYTVLERSVLDKIRQEHNLALSGEVDAATGAKFGKMIGAEFLIVGTVSKFEEKQKGGGVGAILSKKLAGGAAMYESEVGIVVRVIRSTTGEILLSEKVSKKERAIGLAAVTSALGVPMAGGLFKSTSMQTAIEKTIKEVVKIIDRKIPSVAGETPAAQFTEIDMVATGVNFSTLKRLTDLLEKVDGVENVQKSFSGKVANLQIQFKGGADELADALFAAKKDDLNFEITGLDKTKIDLKIVK
ncbi:MAG: CsgG/HfaB family protein [bacterium]